MLRFLIDKFKETPGPLRQTRHILGDLAEEIIDLAEHYVKRAKASNYSEPPMPCCHETMSPPPSEEPKSEQAPPAPVEKKKAREKPKSAKKAKAAPAKAPKRELDVSEEFAAAIDIPANRKKQEFKILAILWDAKERELGSLSAQSVSDHGQKLGLVIRHENVRKVIRMRLSNYVDVRTKQAGNGSVFRYEISAAGSDYFTTTYKIV